MNLPPLARGHVLIVGETGIGKSTAMLAVLKRGQKGGGFAGEFQLRPDLAQQ